MKEVRVCIIIALMAFCFLLPAFACQSQPDVKSTTSTIPAAPSSSPAASVPVQSTTKITSNPPSTTAASAPPARTTLPGGIVLITRWQYTVQRFANTLIFDPQNKGRVFQITGKITTIVKDSNGPNIVVNDGSLPPGFPYASDWRCYFQTDETQLNGLKEGQTVTVQGTWGWGSRVIGSQNADPVFLDNCYIVLT
jgi:hypothetical protein